MYREPLIAEPLLLSTAGGLVVAHDRRNGNTAWSQDLHDSRVKNERRVLSSVQLAIEPPYVAAFARTMVDDPWHTGEIKSTYTRVLCLDYASGRVLWVKQHDCSGVAPLATLHLESAQVLLGFNGVGAFAAEDGRVLWTLDPFGLGAQTPVDVVLPARSPRVRVD